MYLCEMTGESNRFTNTWFSSANSSSICRLKVLSYVPIYT